MFREYMILGMSPLAIIQMGDRMDRNSNMFSYLMKDCSLNCLQPTYYPADLVLLYNNKIKPDKRPFKSHNLNK